MEIDASKIEKIYNQYYKDKGERQEYLNEYYLGNKDVIPVYKRRAISPLKQKTHTNLHTNFFEDIVNRKVGYMGQHIEYIVNIPDDEEQVREDIGEMSQALKDFERKSRMLALNSESVDKTATQGISHRLAYTKDGEFKLKNIDGWQVVYDYDDDIFDPKAAYYYYSVVDLEGEEEFYCNVYDKQNVYYYKKESNDFVEDLNNEGIEGNSQPHNFSVVPIFPFINNANWYSNCQDTVDLMDQYDEIVSDVLGEIKGIRMAYLKIWGDLYTGKNEKGEAIPIPDFIQSVQAFIFGKTAEGETKGDASFLEKTLDDEAIVHKEETLRSSIYEQSGSVDLRELTSSSSARVISIKAMLMRLEDDAKTTENYFITALNKQVELWIEHVKLDGIDIDPSEISVNVGRNFILDEELRAKVLAILLQSMSAKDAYELAGYQDSTGLAERKAKEDLGGLLAFEDGAETTDSEGSVIPTIQGDTEEAEKAVTVSAALIDSINKIVTNVNDQKLSKEGAIAQFVRILGYSREDAEAFLQE